MLRRLIADHLQTIFFPYPPEISGGDNDMKNFRNLSLHRIVNKDNDVGRKDMYAAPVSF